MKDYMNIGSTPISENCQQVGSATYATMGVPECQIFARQLARAFPLAKPEGCQFVVKAFQHDFGTYHEVVTTYDDEIQEQIDFALMVESYTPEYWDETAIAELTAAGIPFDDLERPKDPRPDDYIDMSPEQDS